MTNPFRNQHLFPLLLCATLPMSVRVAKADIQQSFKFDGVLANQINGSTSVTGQFTIDFTTASITAFDLITPYRTLDGTSVVGNNFSGWGASIFEIGGITELAFRHYAGGSADPFDYPLMDLLFQSPWFFSAANGRPCSRAHRPEQN